MPAFNPDIHNETTYAVELSASKSTPARTIQEARENLAKLRAQRALKPALEAINKAKAMSILDYWQASNGLHVVEIREDRSIANKGTLWL
jgi:hypothetical protein